MNSSRRNFLKKSGLALASSLASPSLFSFIPTHELLGIQLYSVRDDMKRDALGTLRQVAAIGYKQVEHANYVDRKFYGYAPAEFKKVLADLGMTMPSGHTVLRKEYWDNAKKDFTDGWKQTVEDAAIAGQKFVVSPSLDSGVYKTEDMLKQFLHVFNKSGELCKKSGMKFGYHNHSFEFKTKFGNRSLYDIILEHTDPSLVVHQLDTGNLFNGGVTALEIVKKYPTRFELMHVKDEIASTSGDEKYVSTVLGKGIAHVQEVIDLARKGGGKLFIVEQESYQDMSPIACAKEDYKIMKKWGY